jgi:hypothetical protein
MRWSWNRAFRITNTSVSMAVGSLLFLLVFHSVTDGAAWLWLLPPAMAVVGALLGWLLEAMR